MIPICNTCKTKLDDNPYRVIVLKDNEGEPIVIYFHYFFPCWDIDLVSQRFPDSTIVDAGFSVEFQNISKNIKKIKNLKQNEELWE